jgi:hypothetical protein
MNWSYALVLLLIHMGSASDLNQAAVVIEDREYRIAGGVGGQVTTEQTIYQGRTTDHSREFLGE